MNIDKPIAIFWTFKDEGDVNELLDTLRRAWSSTDKPFSIMLEIKTLENKANGETEL